MRKIACMCVLMLALWTIECYGANEANTNPIIIDTLNEQVIAKTDVRDRYITSISVFASAASWAVNLTDEGGGDSIFEQQSAITNNLGGTFYLGRVPLKGLYVDNLRNVEKVLIYTTD